VVQAGGEIRLIDDDRLLGRPFLDIRPLVKARGVRSSPGMPSLAFPPDYPRTGLFYVTYTDHRDRLVLARYNRSAADPLVADPASADVLLRIPEPTPAHHGGLLAFGPDGHLYLATGDGGPAKSPPGNAQNGQLLVGKVVRIDPASEAHEIWATGLRNPRGLSFDRNSDTVAIADTGDNRYEEINYLPTRRLHGANFGWPAFEAFAPLLGGVPRHDTVLPAIAYRHRPGCAVAGGYVVRDGHLARIRGREIFGDYVFGDYCTGKLYGFRPRAGHRAGKQRSFDFGTRYLYAIGRDDSGRIYLLTVRGPNRKGKATLGSVYRLVPHRNELP
jgi:hypothetical protein